MEFPASTPLELSNAIVESVDAGANIINLSMGLSTSALNRYNELKAAFNYALLNDVIVVMASGNQGSIGGNPLLKNQWIIPVVACDNLGRLSSESNVGPSVGKRGLMAPGLNMTSTAPGNSYTVMSGTSVAAAFVSGAIALLWSAFPNATSAEIRESMMPSTEQRRHTMIPRILNAEKARKYLKTRLK